MRNKNAELRLPSKALQLKNKLERENIMQNCIAEVKKGIYAKKMD
jgi:hypothetical protein